MATPLRLPTNTTAHAQAHETHSPTNPTGNNGKNRHRADIEQIIHDAKFPNRLPIINERLHGFFDDRLDGTPCEFQLCAAREDDSSILDGEEGGADDADDPEEQGEKLEGDADGAFVHAWAWGRVLDCFFGGALCDQEVDDGADGPKGLGWWLVVW